MTTNQTLNRQKHLTVVLVTHEPDMAAFADRIVTMRDGVIVSDERNQPGIAPVPLDGSAVSVPATPMDAGPGGSRKIFSFPGMALRVAGRATARNNSVSTETRSAPPFW